MDKSHQASFTIIVHTNSLNASWIAHWLQAALPFSAFVARAWWTGGNTCVRSPAAEGGRAEPQNTHMQLCSTQMHIFSCIIKCARFIKHHYVGWVYYQQENILSGPVKPITVWIQGRGFHLLTTLFLGLWEILKWVSRWELLPHIKWVLIMLCLSNNFFLGDLTRKLVWILNNIFNWY